MRFLLDTVTFLLAIEDEGRVSREARKYIEDPYEQVYLSSASAWEITIKHALGKLDLPMPPDRLVPMARERLGAEELPLGESSALRVSRLPQIHADPFDRVLVAQAISTGMTILTPDEAIRQYPVPTIW
ncbi:MAG: type II toxin-antitoxin system VapC family toxin [Candidatus Limnocylindrales bacterium]